MWIIFGELSDRGGNINGSSYWFICSSVVPGPYI